MTSQDLASTPSWTPSEQYGAGTGGDAGTAEQAKQAAHDVAGTAKTEAGSVAQEAKQQAANLTGQLRQQVDEQARTQQDRLVGLLRELGDELRSMTTGQGGTTSGTLHSLAEQADDKTRSLADWLEQRQPGDVLDEVRSFARRRPGLFLAGAAALGIVAGRATRTAKEVSSNGSGTTPSYQSPGTPARYGTTETTYGTTAGDAPVGTPYDRGVYTDETVVETDPLSVPQPPPYGTDPTDPGQPGRPL